MFKSILTVIAFGVLVQSASMARLACIHMADKKFYPCAPNPTPKVHLDTPSILPPVSFGNFGEFFGMKPIPVRLQNCVAVLLQDARIEELRNEIIKTVNSHQYSSLDVYRLEDRLSAMIQFVLSDRIFTMYFSDYKWFVSESIRFAAIPKYFKNGQLCIPNSITDFCQGVRPFKASMMKAKPSQTTITMLKKQVPDLMSTLPLELINKISEYYLPFKLLMRLLNRSFYDYSTVLDHVYLSQFAHSRLSLLSAQHLASIPNNDDTIRFILDQAPLITAIMTVYQFKSKERLKWAKLLAPRLRATRPTGIWRYLWRLACNPDLDKTCKQAIRFMLLQCVQLPKKGNGALTVDSCDAKWSQCRSFKKYR